MRIAKTVLGAVCFFALTAFVLAQPGGGPGGPGGPGRGGGPGGPGAMNPVGMLTHPEFKSELGITEEQSSQLEAVAKEISDKMQTMRDQRGGRNENMTEEQRRAAFEKMRTDGEKLRAEAQAKVESVLTPEQIKKSKVLAFQISGGLNSNRPLNANALDALELTAEQKAKIKSIEDKSREEMMAAFRELQGKSESERREAFREMRAKGEERMKKMNAEIESVLTTEQKALAAKLTEEGKEVREKFERLRNERRGERRGGERRGPEGQGEAFRPAADSWKPGQGVVPKEDARPRTGRRFGE